MQVILDQIRNIAGEDFIADEAALIKAVESDDAHKSGVAVKILSVVGGFMAGIAFLGFMLIAGLYESEAGLIATGVIFTALSVTVISSVNNLVVASSIVSLYMMGLALIAGGMAFLNVHTSIICLVLILVALVSMLINQNWIFAFISVLVINGSLIAMILLNDSYNNINFYVPAVVIAFLWVTMNEAKLYHLGAKIVKLYEPVRVGFIISVISGLVLVGVRDIITLDYRMIWWSAIVTIGGVVFLVWKLLPVLEVQNFQTKVLIFSLSIVMFAPTAMTPAVSGSMLIILACFYVNYKPGFVMGLLAFIYFISQYYYDLHLTLLVKSGILMLSGLIFILCYFVTIKKLPEHEKV